MSEESIKSPVVPKSTDPDNDSLRSNSTGKSGSSKSAKKSIPHYLRASTGSCHDICKYGRRLVSEEEKPWRTMRKRIAAKPPHVDGHSLAENEIHLSSRKKSPGVKPKPSSQTSSHLSDLHEIVKHEVLPKSHGSRRNSLGTEFVGDRKLLDTDTLSGNKVIKVVEDRKSVDTESFSGKKAVRASLKPSSDCLSHKSDSVDIIEQDLSTELPGCQNPLEDEVHDSLKTEVLSVENNSETDLKSSCDSKSSRSASPDIVSREESHNARGIKKSKEPKLLSGRKEKEVAQHISSDSKARFSDDSECTKHMLPASGKFKVSSKEASLKASARNASLKIKPVAVKASASPDPSNISKSNIKLETSNKAGTSKLAVKKVQRSPASSSNSAVRKVQASPRASASKVKASPTVFVAPRPVLSRVPSSCPRKNRSQKVGFSIKNRKNKNSEPNQPVDDNAEKTLYVIKVNSERKCSETEDNESHTKLHPCPSPMPKPQSFTNRDSVNKREPRRMPRKAATAASEDKDSKSVKLNFQRGKVIDIQSETNSPRRLKYRQGRIMADNQNGKVITQRKSFKQQGPVERYNGSKAGSEKVVLKHQVTVGKKDAQGLLNYLIEETASKLVETRKSKVKALVGAFESVISSKKPNQ